MPNVRTCVCGKRWHFNLLLNHFDWSTVILYPYRNQILAFLTNTKLTNVTEQPMFTRAFTRNKFRFAILACKKPKFLPSHFSNQNVNLMMALFEFDWTLCFRIIRAHRFSFFFLLKLNVSLLLDFILSSIRKVLFFSFILSSITFFSQNDFHFQFIKQVSSWNWSMYSGQSTSKSMSSLPTQEMPSNGYE